jgi:hypothetical protein
MPNSKRVQRLGQPTRPVGQPMPDEIGQQLDALALLEAKATRIALECRVKSAELLLQMQEQHGFNVPNGAFVG